MSKKLIEKILNQKVTKKTNEKMTTIQLYKEKGTLSMNEVIKLIDTMEKNLKKSGKKNVRIMVSGLAPDRMRNIKYFDRDFDLNEYEEYWSTKVSDSAKFNEFNQIQVYVLESLK
jgi:hypothetical protein